VCKRVGHKHGCLSERCSPSAWRRAVSTFQKPRPSIRGIAKAFAAEARFIDEVAMYRAAVRRHALNADLHFELGRLLVDQFGATEAALGPFMEAVRRRPRFPEALLALARVQYELQVFDEAVRQYRSALELLPDSPEALQGLREALAASGADSPGR
jgi:tetratricopeptide (TPR) repeat protein